MNVAHSQRDQIVTEALGRVATTVRHAGSGHWGVVLDAAPTLGVTAALRGDWLILETPMVGVQKPSAWRLLSANGGMRGGVRFVVNPPGCAPVLSVRAPVLRVDVPASAGADVAPLLIEACDAMRQAAADWCDDPPPGAAVPRPASWAGTTRAAAWRAALAELDLPSGGPGDDRVEIELESRAGRHAVWLGPGIGGDVMRIELVAAAGLTPVCRDAIGLFLLRAASALSATGPMVVPGAASEPVVFQSTLPAVPDAAAAGGALGALALAVEHCGLEVRALCHEPLARAWLHPFEVYRQSTTGRPMQRQTGRFTEPVLHGG
jgi:hypothetical protein